MAYWQVAVLSRKLTRGSRLEEGVEQADEGQAYAALTAYPEAYPSLEAPVSRTTRCERRGGARVRFRQAE